MLQIEVSYPSAEDELEIVRRTRAEQPGRAPC